MKKKNEKKVEKNDDKQQEKETKVIKKTSQRENEMIVTKDTVRLVKVFASLAVFFASIITLIVFVFGIITTLSVANGTGNEVVHNGFTTAFISKINNVPIDEVQVNILSYNSKFVYIASNIVLPSIAIICVALLIIFFAHLLVQFFDGTLTEKELFNVNKLRKLEEIMNVLGVIMFVLSLLFDVTMIIMAFIVYVLLLIIHFLFKKCINKDI